MFESKDTDMWAGGNSEYSFHPTEEGIATLQSARSTLVGYYRKANLFTKLIPCSIVSLPLAIIFFIVAPKLTVIAFAIPFVCITACIVGGMIMQSKARGLVKDSYVRPVLEGCFDGPTRYDGSKYMRRVQNNVTALHANDVQSVVEYFQIAFEKWSHCTVSDTIASRIYGRDFLFGDVELSMYGKTVHHIFRGQVFVFGMQRAVAGEHVVGFDPRTGELVACPFVRRQPDTHLLRTVYLDYAIQREIGDAPREDLGALAGAVALDAFAKAMHELRDVAQDPFVVFFSGNVMVLVVQSNRDILEMDTGKRRERASEPSQYGESVHTADNPKRKSSLSEEMKNVLGDVEKATAMMIRPSFLMTVFGFGPIEEIEDTCRDDCGWIAQTAGIMARVC